MTCPVSHGLVPEPVSLPPHAASEEQASTKCPLLNPEAGFKPRQRVSRWGPWKPERKLWDSTWLQTPGHTTTWERVATGLLCKWGTLSPGKSLVLSGGGQAVQPGEITELRL